MPYEIQWYLASTPLPKSSPVHSVKKTPFMKVCIKATFCHSVTWWKHKTYTSCWSIGSTSKGYILKTQSEWFFFLFPVFFLKQLSSFSVFLSSYRNFYESLGDLSPKLNINNASNWNKGIQICDFFWISDLN